MNNNPHTVDAFDDDALLALRNATPSDRASKRSSQVVAARRASLPITPISPSGSSLSLSRRGAGPHMPHLAPSPVPPSSRATDTPYDPFNPVRPPTLARTSNVAVSGSCGSSMTRRTDTGMEPVPEDSYTGDYAETRSLQLPPPPGFPDQSHARWSQHSLNHHGHSFLPDAPPSRPPSSTSGRRVALPLTAAFQTSVLRSGNGPSTLSAGASSQKQRYPSIPMSPTPRTRSRPSSVSVSMSGAPGASAATPPSVPGADIMEPPTEALRRMSTSDATYRQPRFRGPAREDDPIGRSHLPSDVRNASPGPSSFRHAMVYHPPPTHASSPSTSLLNPLSPVFPNQVMQTSSTFAPRQSSHHRPSSGIGAPVTWKSLASGSRTSSSQQSHLRDPTRSRPHSVRSTSTLPPRDAVRPSSSDRADSSEDEYEGQSERSGAR